MLFCKIIPRTFSRSQEFSLQNAAIASLHVVTIILLPWLRQNIYIIIPHNFICQTSSKTITYFLVCKYCLKEQISSSIVSIFAKPVGQIFFDMILNKAVLPIPPMPMPTNVVSERTDAPWTNHLIISSCTSSASLMKSEPNRGSVLLVFVVLLLYCCSSELLL